MNVSSIESLSFVTLDGAERKFRLTMRNHKNLAERFGSGFLQMTLSVGLPHILYECLEDKNDITEEGFIDVLPPDEELLISFYSALKKQFTPTVNDRYRPVAVNPTIAEIPPTGG